MSQSLDRKKDPSEKQRERKAAKAKSVSHKIGSYETGWSVGPVYPKLDTHLNVVVNKICKIEQNRLLPTNIE